LKQNGLFGDTHMAIIENNHCFIRCCWRDEVWYVWHSRSSRNWTLFTSRYTMSLSSFLHHGEIRTWNKMTYLEAFVRQ